MCCSSAGWQPIFALANYRFWLSRLQFGRRRLGWPGAARIRLLPCSAITWQPCLNVFKLVSLLQDQRLGSWPSRSLHKALFNMGCSHSNSLQVCCWTESWIFSSPDRRHPTSVPPIRDYRSGRTPTRACTTVPERTATVGDLEATSCHKKKRNTIISSPPLVRPVHSAVPLNGSVPSLAICRCTSKGLVLHFRTRNRTG